MKKQLLYSIFLLFTVLHSGFAKDPKAFFDTDPSLLMDDLCTAPNSLSISNATTTSVQLNWNMGNPLSTAWEILLIPILSPAVPETIPAENPILENGALLISVTGANPFSVISNLNVATNYVSYVRTVCSSSSKSAWSGAFVFNTLVCDQSQKCTYTFKLSNATSSNWNSGRMQVRQNGIVVATLGSGGINSPNGISVALCNDVPFDLYWSIAGNEPENMGVQIINPFQDIIYTKDPGEGTPLTVLFADTTLGNCTPPTCPKPANLLASAAQMSAQLSWTETGSATQWEVCVVADGEWPPVNGTPLNTGIAGYYLATTNSNFLVEGLTTATKYRYYVRAICSSTDIGNWTVLTSKSFITTPINDECSAAISVPVNPTPEIVQTVSGTTLGGTASSEISTCPGSENDDVWFSFVATNSIQLVELKNIIGSTTNLRFAIYSGSTCETMNQMFCSATDNNKAVLINLVVGEMYKIRVYTNGNNSNQTAAFDVSITTPPPPATNDEVSAAIPITGNTLSECINVTPGNLIGATASVGFPTECFGNEDDDVWFSFVANSSHNIITLVDIEGTTTNLNHSVFSGAPDNLTQLYCALNNSSSSSNANFVVGQTYYLRVWSNALGSQVVTFNVCIKPVSTCQTAAPFCGGSDGNIYVFPNTTGIPNATQVACLGSAPNPIYYTLNVSETGPLNFTIYQNTNISPTGQLLGTNLDVDFVAWGPFSSPESCDQIVFGGCSCPNNTVNPNFYPLGNIVDCSYSANATETISIPSAQAGEYYVILITNFNGAPGYISLLQDNYDEPGAGATSCGDSIQLVSFVDANNNGQKEDTEAFFTYGSFTSQKNNSGAINYLNNPMGVQNIYDPITTNTYDFNYQIDSEYADYYALTPTSFNDLNIPFGSGVQTLYFPITVTQTYSDVDVSIIPIGVPRPGFQYSQKIIYRNLGLVSTSGAINFVKANSTILINESIPAASSVNADGFTYNFTNLAPGEIRFITVKMTVPPIPAVDLGDIAATSASITSVENDINNANNTFVINQVVVGSYDPNDKNESRGATINISQFNQDDYLFYTIRFQNEGTASAETVRIEDLLDSEFNVSSIRMISASHHYSMERINNKLVWTFNNINLPAASVNDLLSQGYLTFKIKLNPGFAVNDVIENTAEIYFDFNPAIVTNTFQTTFVPNLRTPTFDGSNLVVYPNPAKEMVQIMMQNSTETMSKIIIYDMIGKTIKTISGNNAQQITIPIHDLLTGVYLIEITTGTNLKQIRKLMVK